MAPAILILAAGYFIGGLLGDLAFKRTPRGRVLISLLGVVLGAVFLLLAMNTPAESQPSFMVFLMLTALFMPFASPNVISTVHDITVPEVRSTALAVQYFIENAGAALAPFIAGLIAIQASLHEAILLICITAWALGALLLVITAYLIPVDVKNLREEIAARAEAERSRPPLMPSTEVN